MGESSVAWAGLNSDTPNERKAPWDGGHAGPGRSRHRGDRWSSIPPRDWHLRGADFVDVTRHREIRASVDSIELSGDGGVVAVAAFDLHGERGRVELRGHVHHPPDPGGNGAGRLTLHLHGTLDMHEFGIRARSRSTRRSSSTAPTGSAARAATPQSSSPSWATARSTATRAGWPTGAGKGCRSPRHHAQSGRLETTLAGRRGPRGTRPAARA